MFWNVQNFGDANPCRGNYVPLCNFIAEVVKNADADILCLMELRQSALMGRLNQLHLSLLNAHNVGGQICEWYCDYVAGSLVYNFFGVPYSPTRVDFTGQGRLEGYAVFWKQNIDKFIMRRADPIERANATPFGGVGFVPNDQSGGVRVRNAAGGLGFLPQDFDVPGGGNQFTLPAGSTVVAPGVIRPVAGGLPITVVPAGVTAGAIQLNASDVVSQGTQVGPAGITFNTAVLGVNPIVVPGNYTLSTNLALPRVNVVLLREHVLGLVLPAKRVIGGMFAPYNPAGGAANAWLLGDFPATAGANMWNDSRLPAYCTIRLNDPAALAVQQLVPITFYHAPLSAPAQAMIRCAIGQPMYETMGYGAPAYVPSSKAIVGGDFNERLDPGSAAYTTFTNSFANNGAGCRTGANQNIRINHPPPGGVPNFPPHPGPILTNADNWLNKSTVQLRHPIVPHPGAGNLPVLSALFSHYRRAAIDNIFYRGFTLAEAPLFEFRATPFGGAQQHFFTNLYDLLRAVSENIPGGAAAAPGLLPDNFFINPAIIAAFNALPVFAILAMGMGPPPGLNESLDPVELLADINAGVFQPAFGGDPPAGPGPYAGPPILPAVITHQRRAAEFIKLFVSDHLPAIFEMDI